MKNNPMFHAVIAKIKSISINFFIPQRVLLNLFECIENIMPNSLNS